MADIIDTQEHGELIALQRAVNDAFVALHAHPRQVGKPGIEWSDEEKAVSQQLRQAVHEAVLAKNRALAESGLPAQHGAYQASQALKDAAKDPCADAEGAAPTK